MIQLNSKQNYVFQLIVNSMTTLFIYVMLIIDVNNFICFMIYFNYNCL